MVIRPAFERFREPQMFATTVQKSKDLVYPPLKPIYDMMFDEGYRAPNSSNAVDRLAEM